MHVYTRRHNAYPTHSLFTHPIYRSRDNLITLITQSSRAALISREPDASARKIRAGVPVTRTSSPTTKASRRMRRANRSNTSARTAAGQKWWTLKRRPVAERSPPGG